MLLGRERSQEASRARVAAERCVYTAEHVFRFTIEQRVMLLHYIEYRIYGWWYGGGPRDFPTRRDDFEI